MHPHTHTQHNTHKKRAASKLSLLPPLPPVLLFPPEKQTCCSSLPSFLSSFPLTPHLSFIPFHRLLLCFQAGAETELHITFSFYPLLPFKKINIRITRVYIQYIFKFISGGETSDLTSFLSSSSLFLLSQHPHTQPTATRVPSLNRPLPLL